MHPGIIRADIPVGCIQRAVQDPHLRIGNGCLHTGLYKSRCGGKDQVTACSKGLDNQFVCIFRRAILIGHGRDLLRERLLQIDPAQLMGVGPGRIPRGLLV